MHERSLTGTIRNFFSMKQRIRMRKWIRQSIFNCCQWWNRIFMDSFLNDSEHKEAMSTGWKKEHGVQYYLNAPKLPDLSPIDNGWSGVHWSSTISQPHWDEQQAKQCILDIFEQEIKQEWINKLVLSMPKRLQDCLARNGALTGW